MWGKPGSVAFLRLCHSAAAAVSSVLVAVVQVPLE